VLVEHLKKPQFLIGLLLVLGGFDIGMSWTYLPRLLGIALILIGIVLISAELRPRKKKTESKEEAALRKENVESAAPRLSNRLIAKLTLRGRLIPYLWIIGLILIAADIALNAFIQKSEIGGNDMIVLFFGVSLIIYDPPPWMRFGTYLKKYTREKDFIVVFLGLLVLILVLPMYVNALLTGNTQGSSGFDRSTDSVVFALLTAPLSGILSILGVENSATGAILTFEMANGGSGTVEIAAVCAGIYSFGIFLSAFIAFVLSEYSRLTRQIGILLVIGAALTYLANLLRMTLIVLAGYYNGFGDGNDPAPFTLLWTHKYAGELIFISWVAVFWWFSFRYLASDPGEEPRKEKPVKNDHKTSSPVAEPADGNDWNDKAAELRKGKTA
jgi:exosortase/archaeosortase family protein